MFDKGIPIIEVPQSTEFESIQYSFTHADTSRGFSLARDILGDDDKKGLRETDELAGIARRASGESEDL